MAVVGLCLMQPRVCVYTLPADNFVSFGRLPCGAGLWPRPAWARNLSARSPVYDTRKKKDQLQNFVDREELELVEKRKENGI